jgi:hypothetical protein
MPRSDRIAARARRRRRRLLLIDVALGVVVALLVLVLGPGLAIVTLGALLVLLICGVSHLAERVLTRGNARSRRADHAPPPAHAPPDAGERRDGAAGGRPGYARAGSSASASRRSSTDW